MKASGNRSNSVRLYVETENFSLNLQCFETNLYFEAAKKWNHLRSIFKYTFHLGPFFMKSWVKAKVIACKRL